MSFNSVNPKRLWECVYMYIYCMYIYIYVFYIYLRTDCLHLCVVFVCQSLRRYHRAAAEEAVVCPLWWDGSESCTGGSVTNTSHDLCVILHLWNIPKKLESDGSSPDCVAVGCRGRAAGNHPSLLHQDVEELAGKHQVAVIMFFHSGWRTAAWPVWCVEIFEMAPHWWCTKWIQVFRYLALDSVSFLALQWLVHFQTALVGSPGPGLPSGTSFFYQQAGLRICEYAFILLFGHVSLYTEDK